MTCIECESAVSKYKCPVCRKFYCSVVCCNKHKERKCEKPQMEPIPDSIEHKHLEVYEFPTDDTIPPEKLQLLDQSEGLKNCLKNKHLQAILEDLDRCPRPERKIKEYMQEPIFTEFVDECLRMIEPQREDVDDF